MATSANKKICPNFIGTTDPTIDKQARDRIVTCRVSMFLRSSAAFFGNIATRMPVVNADSWCGTMATDGRNLYYNSKFVMHITANECKFIIAHECLHMCYTHMDRRSNRNPQLWNIACDYAVNYDLVKSGLGEMPTTISGLYDAKYANMSSEQIYNLLYEEYKDDMKAMDDLIKQLLDEHMDQDGSGDEESKSGNGRPSKMSSAEREELQREIRQSVLAAAQATGAGNLPAGVAQLIKDLTEPKMSWKDLLATTLTSAFRDDFTYMRPSRKSHHLDAYLPGRSPGERVDIGVALDLSGSCIQDVPTFITEVKNIMESFTAYNVHVFTFDTQVYNPQDFSSENMEDILDYELKGDGGTDFECVFEYLEENDKIPDRLVFFTDMAPCGGWGKEICDVLWISKGHPNPQAPFGTVVKYEDV